MIKLQINQQIQKIEVPEETPLLWVLREELHLTATKFGCGKGLCGACTVLKDGVAIRSCITPVGTLNESSITTLEGLKEDTDLHPIQRAWLIHDVVQCGYCQPGQMMTAAALLKTNPNPSEDDISTAMTGNLCRCGTYPRIRAAIKTAAKLITEGT